MEAVPDLRVLDLAQPAVDVQQEVVELLVPGAFLQAEVAVQLGGLHQRPDLAPDGGQLRRVHRRDVGVLVQQLFQPGDVAVGLRAGHRRHQVVDDGGVGAPLGLRPLARVVDQERVDQRQVAQRRVGGAGGRQRGVLAGQPLQRAVLAEVDDGVGAEAVLQPAVRGQVVVARRQLRVVVDRHRVLAEAARRLDQQHDVAGGQSGQHQLPGVVHEQAARGGAPRLGHRGAQPVRQAARPRLVLGRADADVRVGQLRGRQPLLVLAARGDEGVDEGVARLGVGVAGVQDADHGVVLAEVVAVLPEPAQQADGRHRGVEADGVADARVLRRIRGEDDGDPLLRVGGGPQAGVVDGDAGDPVAAFRVGDVAGQPVGVELLERERRGDDPPVELRNGDLRGRVQRRDPVVRSLPLGAAGRETQALEHGYVQRRDAPHIPRLVVTARAHARGDGAPGRQHGHDQRVERAEGRVQAVGGRAQRTREDRDPDGPAGRVDRVGERVGERRVPAGLVGPVVQDADPGQRPAGRRRPVGEPPLGDRGRRLEALARQQHRVGQERVQLGQIGRAALRQVPVGLGRDTGRHRRTRHQLGVRLLLPAQDHQGGAPVTDRPEPLPQVVGRAEEPDDDEVRAVGDGGQIRVAGPRRIGPPPCGAAGARGQQIGVGRGKQRDALGGLGHRQVPPPGFSPRVTDRTDPRPVSGCAVDRRRRHSGGTAPESHRVPVTAGAGQPTRRPPPAVRHRPVGRAAGCRGTGCGGARPARRGSRRRGPGRRGR